MRFDESSLLKILFCVCVCELFAYVFIILSFNTRKNLQWNTRVEIQLNNNFCVISTGKPLSLSETVAI
ncbi:hypothetical protein BpHYR1_041752 [Brachionus plicatilis]|uniref:Uncharacterized protein n=1 Tax=Brachionus plicatilis TaxID=10195 RepID=A0A3M7RW85_BRAPC|nr:hypothetical protein BpHYR1_041752 [Brachionus plicatilis]